MVANSAAPTIEAIAGCCARIDTMCTGLSEAEWHQPTALPGWDVQDIVAHLGSLEARFLGFDEPAHDAAPVTHVRNELGAMNERLVDRRRRWSGAAVLDEFRESTARRIELLSAMDEAELDGEVRAPTLGTMAQRAFLGIRLWDFFVHEQDIAEALGLELDLESTAAQRVVDEMLLLVPRAVARGGAGEGSLTSLVLADPLPRSLTVRVLNGRATTVDAAAVGEATLHLRASPTAFLRVGSGRRSADAAIASGEVAVDGDRDLAVRVLGAVNVVP